MESVPSSALSLRYQGPRFDDHSLPIMDLAELGGLQRALWVLFRYHYRRETSRQRAPKGFRKQLNLKLTALRGGSAVAILEPPSPRQLPPEGSDVLTVEGTILAFLKILSEGAHDYPADVKKSLARCLGELGQNLEDDEFIEIQYAHQQVVYDQKRRKRVLVELVHEFTRTEERVFAVSEYDKHASSFTLMSPTGQTVKVGAGDQDAWKLAALTAFNEFESLAKNSKVLVSGTFTYDHRDQLTRVQPESIEVLAERDMRWRVDFLRHHNHASAVACQALNQWLAVWNGPLEQLQALEHPALYLLDGDRVSAEWDRGQRPVVELYEDRLHAFVVANDLEVEASSQDESGMIARFLVKALQDTGDSKSLAT